MSINLHMVDFDLPQVPEALSRVAFAIGKGSAIEQDLDTLEFLEKHYLKELPPLQGKDKNNPYLVQQWKEARREIQDRWDRVRAALLERAPYSSRQLYLL